MSESAAPARATRICPYLRTNALRQINDDRIDWQLGIAVEICSPSERVAAVAVRSNARARSPLPHVTL